MIVAGLGIVLAAGAGTWMAAARTLAPGACRPSPRPAASPRARTGATRRADGVPRRPGGVRAVLSEGLGPGHGAQSTDRPGGGGARPGQNQGGSILVRVTPLDAPVGKAQLLEARKGTDAIVSSSNGGSLKAEPTETEQGGLPGLYYSTPSATRSAA